MDFRNVDIVGDVLAWTVDVVLDIVGLNGDEVVVDALVVDITAVEFDVAWVSVILTDGFAVTSDVVGVTLVGVAAVGDIVVHVVTIKPQNTQSIDDAKLIRSHVVHSQSLIKFVVIIE